MQISFWSNMHGQGATSATTAACASVISQMTTYKTLVTHNHIERSAIEGYFYKHDKGADINFAGFTNQGIDALIRLIRNGRLSPAMVADYTYSLLKNNRLDILLGTSKKENPENRTLFMSILECAKRFYDLILIDVHSGLNETNSLQVLDESDIIVFCISQNNFLLKDFKETMDRYPNLRSKHAAYVISRYEKHASMTSNNISRRYGLEKESVFVIPDNPNFMRALNNGRVFDFIAYYHNARDGEEKEFISSIKRLCNYITKGCTK